MTLRTLLILVVAPFLALSQGSSSGASVLKIPSHALSAALGDAAVVQPGRLDAAGANPANAFVAGKAISVVFTHAGWIQDISGQRLNVSFPLSIGRIVVGAATTKLAGIEVREQPGPPVATFDAQSATLQVGWAAPVTSGIVAGIGASYLYEKLYVDESTGFEVDLGFFVETPIQDLNVGVALSNLGRMSAFRTEAADLPTTVRAGAEYRMEMGEITLHPTLAARNEVNGRGWGISVASTVFYANTVGLRVSWQSGETARPVGIGLAARYSGIGMDYGIVAFSSGLGTAHIITLGINF